MIDEFARRDHWCSRTRKLSFSFSLALCMCMCVCDFAGATAASAAGCVRGSLLSWLSCRLHRLLPWFGSNLRTRVLRLVIRLSCVSFPSFLLFSSSSSPSLVPLSSYSKQHQQPARRTLLMAALTAGLSTCTCVPCNLDHRQCSRQSGSAVS